MLSAPGSGLSHYSDFEIIVNPLSPTRFPSSRPNEPVSATVGRQLVVVALSLAAAGTLALIGKRCYIHVVLALSGGLPAAAFVLVQFGGVDWTWLYMLSPFACGLGRPSAGGIILLFCLAGLLVGGVYWKGSQNA